MLGASIAEVALNKTSQLAQVLHFIGSDCGFINCNHLLFRLGYAKGFSKDKVLHLQMIALDLLQTYC